MTSSGSMESQGAVSIFARSIEKYNLRYMHFMVTQIPLKVLDSKPYYEIAPKKLECIEHVQKRLGTRLRKLHSDMKSLKLADRKNISGKGRLTDRLINKMQNCFGMAIRPNLGQLYAMKKSVLAILWHFTDIKNLDVRYQFCPRLAISWCKYQVDKISGLSKYNSKDVIPEVVKKFFY